MFSFALVYRREKAEMNFKILFEIHSIGIRYPGYHKLQACSRLGPEVTVHGSLDLTLGTWYVTLTCISLVSEYGLISLSAHGGKEKTWDADKIATKNCIFEVSRN